MTKEIARKRRGAKTRARTKNSGKPRLVVFRSGRHIYAQILIGDTNGDKVLVSSSTMDKELKTAKDSNKCDMATAVGKLLAERANKIAKDLEFDITSPAFDRSGYRYHGRIKALANGAREAGLKF